MAPDTLYLDCFAGISGDMAVSALLDGGVPLEVIREQLACLEMGDYEVAADRDSKGPITATVFKVGITGPQPSRNWTEIRALLTGSTMKERVRELSLAIFKTLAEAEGKVHGRPVDEVHFHEVGAVDSIVDIVGFAAALDHLGPERVICSPLPMSRGTVLSAHGRLPVPAPAVCEILRDVPVVGVDLEQELVTPTGAAIAKTVSRSFGPMPAMVIDRTGYGKGSHQLGDGRPNLLRVITGSSHPAAEAAEVEVITCNLDDWSPEGFPHLAERLFELGAVDVALVPIQMKKGRPGFQVQVICPPGPGWEARRCLLSETTAAGLRFRTEQRWTLPRRTGYVETPVGRIGVKLVEAPDGPVIYPEYESCRQLALAKGLSLKEVYAAAGRCRPEDFREEG